MVPADRESSSARSRRSRARRYRLRVSSERPSVLTIGYGNRRRDEVLALLEGAAVNFLVDVRSAPRSRFNPDFDRSALERGLRPGLKYLFMGDVLGGRPDDPACYDAHGHVDYERCRTSGAFRAGIERIVTASAKGYELCLLCSELRPEECHRSRLLGEMLIDRGVTVRHFDASGRLVDHQRLTAEGAPGQLALLAGGLGRSRRAYRPSG